MAFFLRQLSGEIRDERLEMAVLGYLDNVEVAELAGIDGEADEGTHLMPALQPCGTGVDMKETELAVVLYLEDMAVAADEELGWTGEEFYYVP